MPSGPPEEPAGNDRMALRMSDSLTCRAHVDDGSGAGFLSCAAAGCLTCRQVKVASLSGAGLSSEHRILTAAVILPSSILAETAAARDAKGSVRFLG